MKNAIDHEKMFELLCDDDYTGAGNYLLSVGVKPHGVEEALKNEEGYKYGEDTCKDLSLEMRAILRLRLFFPKN